EILREPEEKDARRQNAARKEPRLFILPMFAEAVNEPDRQKPEERGPEARGKLGLSENRKADRRQPIHQRRLFEIENVIQVGTDPVFEFQHFARDLGVTAFI